MAEPVFHMSGIEQARQDVMLGVAVVMTMVGVACVGLRVYTRAFVVRNIGMEDWTMVGAAVLTLVYLFTLIAASREFKLGFSGASMTMAQMQGNIQVVLAIIMTYKTIMTLIKVSILMTYLKFAVSTRLQRLCQGTIALLVTYDAILIIIVPSQCRPLSKLWDLTGEVEGSCINANAYYLTTSIFHILMDVWILILPVKLLLSIPRPIREKLALLGVFGLGIFSMIASIVRLQSLIAFTKSNDPFFDTLPINIWSMVEVNIGILCASLPTLRPLVSRSQRTRTREALQGSGRHSKPGKKIAQKAIFTHAKEVSISHSPSSSKRLKKAIVDEEMQDLGVPPPVPPKDVKINARPIKQIHGVLPEVERDSSFGEVFIKLSQSMVATK